MTRALEKTAIGKFITACAKYDKRIAKISYTKVHVGRPDAKNVVLHLVFNNHTYEGKFNIKDVLPR